MSEFDEINATTLEGITCGHPLSDHEKVLTRVEIKDYENKKMTVIYRYACFLHPGKAGTYKVVLEI